MGTILSFSVAEVFCGGKWQPMVKLVKDDVFKVLEFLGFWGQFTAHEFTGKIFPSRPSLGNYQIIRKQFILRDSKQF